MHLILPEILGKTDHRPCVADLAILDTFLDWCRSHSDCFAHPSDPILGDLDRPLLSKPSPEVRVPWARISEEGDYYYCDSERSMEILKRRKEFGLSKFYFKIVIFLPSFLLRLFDMTFCLLTAFAPNCWLAGLTSGGGGLLLLAFDVGGVGASDRPLTCRYRAASMRGARSSCMTLISPWYMYCNSCSKCLGWMSLRKMMGCFWRCDSDDRGLARTLRKKVLHTQSIILWAKGGKVRIKTLKNDGKLTGLQRSIQPAS